MLNSCIFPTFIYTMPNDHLPMLNDKEQLSPRDVQERLVITLNFTMNRGNNQKNNRTFLHSATLSSSRQVCEILLSFSSEIISSRQG